MRVVYSRRCSHVSLNLIRRAHASLIHTPRYHCCTLSRASHLTGLELEPRISCIILHVDVVKIATLNGSEILNRSGDDVIALLIGQ